jgi:hypothetical protein
MKSETCSRNPANTGNTARIATTAVSSGTTANNVVYESAPAVSKHLSSRNRYHRNFANAFSRSRRST